ncbi:hypothetical protein ANCCAN_21508 [Ancylostoma caninum]|uniref:Uncharacterized protein n=1 Tax=Ancylostoma caninum TaxID=29170 RepID=A0A368FPF5_ANCCA|nr:hypothetical protein ANCCAN_21508 [Ancylostoma caninum]
MFKFRMKRFVSALQKQDTRDQKGESVEKTKTDKQPIFQDRIKPTEAQKTVFDAFVKGVFENGVEGLIKEYAVLKPYLAASYSREIFDQNSIKNRYKGTVDPLTSKPMKLNISRWCVFPTLGCWSNEAVQQQQATSSLICEHV